MPSPSQRPSVGQLLDRERVAVLGGLGDQRAGDRVGVAAGPVEQVARRAASRRAAAARASRTSAEPLAYCSKQPWLPQPQRMPSGTTRMWPISRAHPERAAVELAVEDDAAADAGADGDQQQVVDVVAGAELELAPRGGVGVVLDHDRQVDARLEVGLEVDVAPGEVGREQHDGAGLVDVAGRADADRLDLRGGRAAR